jgi:hypothetical protein
LVKCLLKKDHPLLICEGDDHTKEMKKQGYIAADIDMLHADISDQIEAALESKPVKRAKPKAKTYETKDMAAESKADSE